jgi:signal transduction histidine kinase
MAEALDDGVAADAVTVRRYHSQIRRDAERLGGLVDNLFELSRLTRGAVELDRRPVALGDVVDQAVRAAAAPAAARGVRLEVRVAEELPRMAVGVRELGRVFTNLLENAVRHTPPGEAVVLEAVAEGGPDGAGDGGTACVRVAVRDTCGGIPAADLPRVFDPAFRGDAARSHDHRGGGLGLAIARGLVEAHGGSITVRNEGDGCRFTVRLPRATSDSANVAHLARPVGPLKPTQATRTTEPAERALPAATGSSGARGLVG